MPTVKQVLADPKFYHLPEGERLKVISSLDKNFSLLPQAEQLKVVNVGNLESSTEQWQPGLAEQFLTGIGKGIASTVYGGGDIIRKTLGMKRIYPEIAPKLEAKTPAEKVGKFTEQAAEFLVPGTAISKVSKEYNSERLGAR